MLIRIFREWRKGSLHGKFSVSFLIAAWTCNAIGIETRSFAFLYMGLAASLLAGVLGMTGLSRNKKCGLSAIGGGIGFAVAAVWVVMAFVGWERFFEL